MNLRVARFVPKTLVAILVAGVMMSSGCTFNFLDKSIIARPAVRVPGASYLEPDGDRVSQDRFEPEGDAVFLLIRVRHKDAVEKAKPWKIGDGKRQEQQAGD